MIKHALAALAALVVCATGSAPARAAQQLVTFEDGTGEIVEIASGFFAWLDNSGALVVRTPFSSPQFLQPIIADGAFVVGPGELAVFLYPTSDFQRQRPFWLDSIDVSVEGDFVLADDPFSVRAISDFFTGSGLDSFVTVVDPFKRKIIGAPSVITVGYGSGQPVADFRPNAIDNVLFTPVPVPEPAAWALMIVGFGAAGTALRRRRGLVQG